MIVLLFWVAYIIAGIASATVFLWSEAKSDAVEGGYMRTRDDPDLQVMAFVIAALWPICILLGACSGLWRLMNIPADRAYKKITTMKEQVAEQQVIIDELEQELRDKGLEP